MNHAFDWFWLIVFAFFSLQYAVQGWSLRGSLRHLAGAGECVRCFTAATGLALLAVLKALVVLEQPVPPWFRVSILAMGVAYLATLAWCRVDEVREEWTGTTEVPDERLYPTIGWKRTAVLATLLLLPTGYVLVRWEEPYTGIVAMCAAMLSACAWGHWIWQRLEWHLIRRFQRTGKLKPQTV